MVVWKRQLSVAVVSLSACLWLISPANAQDFSLTLPEPTGSPVGYRLVTAVDEAREEIFTEDAEDVRMFPMAIYYPATPEANAVPAPYSTQVENDAYNTALQLPSVVFNGIEGHLYIDAPLTPQEGGYPVLLFSPGFGAPIRFYSTLLSEVASQGFVVVAVDHPYSQTVSFFPDNSAVVANTAGSNLETTDSLERVLNVWIEDTLYALDYLSELNEGDTLLTGAFDFERVGAFGHSFGGATAANVSLVDDRILASINMDGTVFGDAAEGVDKPFMTMTAENIELSDEDLATIGVSRETLDAIVGEYNDSIYGALAASEAPYRVEVAGTLHTTFSIDVALLRKILPEFITPEVVGTIDGARANEVFAAYTVAFFDTYLLNEPSPLLEGASTDYPEVTFVTE